MYLDYSKLEFDDNGLPETPELALKTLGDKMVGVIPGVFNLRLNIKFSEPSEISFDIPSVIDGQPNPLYDDVTGYKQIYTKCYGVYETLNPSTSSDGIREVKHVKGFSYEKTMESKKLFLEEGTFNFWNPVMRTDTVLGRILEVAVGWSAGYVSPSLIGRYRTFDQYDDYLLSFMYNQAPKKYRCVFVFDTYKRTINVYDADEERPSLPIYLDFDNLVKSLDIEEKSDELVTAVRPYGSDELSIRDINPIGTNWIYDLSYFIANGDIGEPLASRWVSWQRSILNRQAYYRGLTALRASATARLTAAKAALTDLKGELESLTAQQSVTIQASAMEVTDAGKAYQQSLLNEINAKINTKKQEISAQESAIAAIDSELNPNNPSSYAAQIKAVVNELSISNYFTAAEYKELSNFLIEQDITEDTFVATDVDTSISGSSHPLSMQQMSISGSSISEIDLTAQFGKRMYTMSGGSFAVAGSPAITGDIIRGTLEAGSNGKYVLSFYAGSIRVNDKTASSGMITLSGTMTGFSTNVTTVTTRYPTDLGEDIFISTREGTALSFTASGSLYLTASVNEYQRYSIEMELYQYAVGVLDDLATPTYEFSVDSGNFLFAQEFAPFRNQLELGKGVYLNVGSRQTITPYIIEFELDFENRNNFSIVFSNRFKRHDNVNTLKDMIETSYSASRSFDASKYIYNQAAGQASVVSEFMSNSLEAAKNTILAAANQSVVINGAGIHVGGDSKYQIRIVDSMIAMSDDNWATCKMALGHFASPEIGEYFGVNAEIIGGKLLIGNNLVIDTGKGHFKVDESGVYINSMKFYIQNDGNKTLNGELNDIANELSGLNGDINSVNKNLTNKIAEFYSSGYLNAEKLNGVISAQQAKMRSAGGNVMFDSDGIWLLNGTSKAASTKAIWMNNEGILFGTGGKTPDPGASNSGWKWTTAIGRDGITADALAGKTISGGKLYGGEIHIGPKPGGGYYFNVDSKGNVIAETGTFKGTLSSAKISGDLTADNSGGWLRGCGISVGGNYQQGIGNFYVDSNGNVTMKGSINLSGGSITWSSTNTPVQYQFSADRYSWHSTMFETDLYRRDSLDGGRTWGAPYQFRGRDGHNGQNGQNGQDANVTWNNIKSALQYADNIQSTFITADSSGAPKIYGGTIYGSQFYGSEFAALLDSGQWNGFVIKTKSYGDVFRIYYNNMGGFGPEAVIRGNGGTLTFSNWSHIVGLNTTATFA